jgi:hypothetical protein
MMRFFGWVAYVCAAVACLWFLTVPLCLLLGSIGLVTGLVAALVVIGIVIFDESGQGVLTPAGARHGLPGRVALEFVRRDHAWPQYFAAQVVLDGWSAIRRGYGWARIVWTRTAEWLTEINGGGYFFPLVLIPPVATLLAASAGLAAGLAVVLLVMAVVALAAWVAGVPVVYLLRTVDAAWRRLFQARASCTSCYATADVPAYRCQGPHSPAERTIGDDLHRDLRPGRLGLLWRRCSCGVRLPTMVLRAAFSSSLEACCPSCGQAMFDQAGVVRDVRAPVFGAASAGKTQFIMTALVGLRLATEKAGVPLTLPDEQSRAAFAVYSGLVARGAPAPKTDTAAPLAVSARIEQGVNTTLLHLFDAAGETLTNPEQNAALSYLDHAESLAFVLDPFSIQRIRDEHGVSSAPVFGEANAALHDAEDSYNATAQRLQEYGVRTSRRRLAFVVTKADLLARLPLDMPARDPAAVRAWLCEQGLDNLVVTAERDFRQVRFFLVAGRDTGPDGPVSVLRWMLAKGWGNIG